MFCIKIERFRMDSFLCNCYKKDQCQLVDVICKREGYDEKKYDVIGMHVYGIIAGNGE